MINSSFRRNGCFLLGLALTGALVTPRCCADDNGAPVVTLTAGDNAGALNGVTAAAFVPGADGAEPSLATLGADKIVHLWEWRDGKLLQSLPGLPSSAGQLIVAPDGKTFAASGSSGEGKTRVAEVRVWSLPGGQSKTVPAPDSELGRIAFWPDAKTLAVMGRQKAPLNTETVVLLYDVTSGALLKSLLGHYPDAFDAVGGTLLEGHFNRRTAKDLPGVARWDLTTGDYDAALWPVSDAQKAGGMLPTPGDADFSPDARRVAVLQNERIGVSQTLWMFQSAPLRPLFSLAPAQGDSQTTFRSVRFAGRLLLTQEGGGVTAWDAESGDLLATLPAIANVLAVSPDGRWLAARPAVPRKAKADATRPSAPVGVQVWDLSGFKPLKESQGVPLVAGTDGARTVQAPDFTLGGRNEVAFSSDGQTLVSGNGNLLLSFDAQTGARLHTRTGTGGGASLAVSPDGRWVLTGSEGEVNAARLWDARTLLMTRELGQHEWGIGAVAFSPDSRLAVAASSSLISVWETATGKKLKSLVNNSNRTPSLAFSPDGKLLASSDEENGIDLWNVTKIETDPSLTQDKPDHILQGNATEHNALVFSQSGKTLFAATPQGEIEVFDVTTGKVLRAWQTGDEARLRALALSHDGKRLATVSGPDTYPKPASPDGIVKIWDAATGKLQRTIVTTGVSARSAAFQITPRGQTLAVGLADGSIKLWPMD